MSRAFRQRLDYFRFKKKKKANTEEKKEQANWEPYF